LHLDRSLATARCRGLGPDQLPVGQRLENAQLHEFAIGDARYPDTSTDIWEEIQANGRTLHVVRPKAHLPRAMLALERDGTSLYITSETLKRGRIITLATTLVPVPDAA